MVFREDGCGRAQRTRGGAKGGTRATPDIGGGWEIRDDRGGYKLKTVLHPRHKDNCWLPKMALYLSPE